MYNAFSSMRNTSCSMRNASSLFSHQFAFNYLLSFNSLISLRQMNMVNLEKEFEILYRGWFWFFFRKNQLSSVFWNFFFVFKSLLNTFFSLSLFRWMMLGVKWFLQWLHFLAARRNTWVAHGNTYYMKWLGLLFSQFNVPKLRSLIVNPGLVS